MSTQRRTGGRRPLMVLVTGPDRAVAQAVRAVFDAGHIPVTDLAPSTGSGYLRRLLPRCDAVLAAGGPPSGCDHDHDGYEDDALGLARWEGKPIYRDVADMPPSSTSGWTTRGPAAAHRSASAQAVRLSAAGPAGR
jgi:hypothetical protein